MTEHKPAEKIISMRQFAGKLDSRAANLMRKLQEAAVGGLGKLVGDMLDKADDTLFDLANKAESNASQQLYFDAMRNIRLQRAEIERGFGAEMNGLFERFIAGKPLASQSGEATELADELNLSLVDDDDMEEEVALKNMTTKAERECYNELFEITVRLAALTRRNELDETAHPFYPGAIAHAFGETVSPMDMDIKVRLIVYKLFEKHVLTQARGVLKEINQILVREGVLPKIKHKVRRSPGTAAPGGAVHGVPGGGAAGADPAGGDFTGELVPQVPGGFMFSPGDGAVGDATGGGFAGFVPSASNLLGALSDIQGYVVENGYPEELSPRQVGAQLIQVSRQISGGSSAGGADERTISMVAMIFDYILEDEDVPDPVKAQIARLQIPVLKLALLDREFFSRRKHPARELLNEMAVAAVGWNPDREHDGQSLLQVVGQVVDRVLSEFDDDPGVFESLLVEFREWRAEEQERAELFEERARRTTEGKERVEFARRRTEAWIEMWVSRDDVPPFVAEFLRTVWKNTLLITMHRHGEESREWARRVKTVNNLLWSLTPKKTEKGGRLLVEMIPGIVQEIREGMELASAHPDSIEAFLRDLAKLHAKTVNGGIERDLGDEPAEEEAAEWHASAEGDQLLPEEVALLGEEADIGEADIEEIVLGGPERDDKPVEERDEYFDLAESIAPGTWLQLTDAQGETFRAKLSWRSPLTGCCLFVDRKGIKVAEKSLSALAAELRGGRTTILDDVPLLDRAISALMDHGFDHLEPAST